MTDTERADAIDRRIARLEARIATIATAQIAEAATIRDVWLIYAAVTLPPAAGPATVDRDECRRAFYTGAAAALGLFFSFAELDEDTGVDRIDALRQELDGFVEDLAEARP